MAGRRPKGPNPQPLYLEIADQLRRAHQPGEQLPTLAVLAKTWGVATETVRSAFEVLRREGLIVALQGVGTFYIAADQPAGGVDLSMVLRQLATLNDRLNNVERRLREIGKATRPVSRVAVIPSPSGSDVGAAGCAPGGDCPTCPPARVMYPSTTGQANAASTSPLVSANYVAPKHFRYIVTAR